MERFFRSRRSETSALGAAHLEDSCPAHAMFFLLKHWWSLVWCFVGYGMVLCTRCGT